MIAQTVYHALFIFVAGAFVFLWLTNLFSIGVSRDKFYSPTEGMALALPRFFLLVGSFAGIAAYCIHPGLMSWSALLLPASARFLGFFIGLVALFFFFRVLRALGRNFSTSLTVQRDQTLVVRGPYRWVRHPMYVSFVALWIGYLLLSGNWFIGLTGISGFVLAIVVRTPKEEKMMIDRFGAEYLDYMKRTGRFLPRLSGRKASPER